MVSNKPPHAGDDKKYEILDKGKGQENIKKIFDDIDVMENFVTDSGRVMPVSLIGKFARIKCFRRDLLLDVASEICEDNYSEILSVHRDLSLLVAPATPATITASKRLKFGLFINTAAINLIIISTIVSMIGVVVSCAYMSTANSIWAKHALLPFAAGLGAGFYALYSAHTYIQQRTYDPQYDQTYYVRYILGIIAGVILGYTGADIIKNIDVAQGGKVTKSVGSMLFAVVGGYSADVVYLLLQRFTETLKATIQGNNSSKTDKQMQDVKNKAANEVSRTKNDIASQLQAAINRNGGIKKEDIEKTLNDLLS
ncbi:MAG: hypothetical protein K9K66_16895 [Desulfarculaceae bacterium]|nr:hypothetical protein [Desulfarculaceae bacterium]MCF8072591.1 hypothetical protein [Desulfarculaceae bacterium]MCF8103337.1 hypothetical protein [Desulfarculaceae bacterium]MCF8117488.1 hypothetical protein [Desulfarculaceae bacterium]